MHGLAYVYGVTYYAVLSLSFSRASTLLFVSTLLLPAHEDATSTEVPPMSQRVPWLLSHVRQLGSNVVWEGLLWRWSLFCKDSNSLVIIVVRRTHAQANHVCQHGHHPSLAARTFWIQFPKN
jgi:hypothetical protein